jgi:uncharacterized protein YjbI with pentapeptide repeats
MTQRINRLTFWVAGIAVLTLTACLLLEANQRSASTHADYRRLEKLLRQGKWQAADRETLAQMLVAADRQKQGWLSAQAIETFPCEDFATIDRIWLKYSDRRFGFSMQKRIWEAVGGKPGTYDRQIALKLGEWVGWQKNGQWYPYDRLTFTADAPVGHLPATTGNGVSGGAWGGVATLAGRVKTCKPTFERLPNALQKQAEKAVQQHQAALRAGARHCKGCYLVGANLSGLDLSLGDLSFADLRNANLQNTILGAAKLRYADLRGANLEGAILRQANLLAANFENANLKGADFHCGAGSCTYLFGTSFQGANLQNANLACLDCDVVDRLGLDSVNLAGANLRGAIVEGTRWQNVNVNLCGAMLPNGTRSQQGCDSEESRK